jgi:hypothetical protein
MTTSVWRLTPELGRERRCSRCRQWWPADTEFFTVQPTQAGGLHSWCKACAAEVKSHHRPAAGAVAQGATP